MDIIVTGAAGFIGSNLTKALLDRGHTVIGIDNLSHGSKTNIEPYVNNKNFIFIEKDLKDPTIFNSISGDAIVHLASQKIPRYSNALFLFEENNRTLNNVIAKCLKDKIKMVFASTSDIYGKNPSVPYHETSDIVLGPTTIKRWAYAVSKIYSEQLIIANNNEYDLEYTIMRFFGSFGPHQNTSWWGGPQSVFIANSLKKIPLEIHGNGLQTRTFTYIEDTIQGILKCIFESNARNEIFNVASHPDEEISILDLGTIIWKLINGEGSEPLFNFIPYETFGSYEDVMRRVPDISKIKNLLDFNPQYSLMEGLKKTIAWQKTLPY